MSFTNYLEFDAERLAFLLRDALLDADCQDEVTLDLAASATAAADTPESTKPGLQALCRAIWNRIDLICHPWPWSLRTATRFYAGLGAYDALTAVITLEMRRPRSPWADLVTIRDGRLWIPDALLLTLDYVLEVELAGYGPGFADDPQGAWAKEALPGFGVFLQRYVEWLGESAPVVTGFVSHPAHWLSYPARGVVLDSVRIKAFLSAWSERQNSFGPTLVTKEPRSPLAWLERLPIGFPHLIRLGIDPMASTLAEAAIDVRGRSSAWREDPLIGLRAALSSTGETDHARAFRRVLIDLLRDATSGQVEARGSLLQVSFGTSVEPLVAAVVSQGTIVHGSALGVLLLQAGRCIRAWQEYPQDPMNWSYQSLLVGGWGAVIDRLFPTRFRLSPDPLPDGNAPWLLIPEIRLPLQPLAVQALPDQPVSWYQRQPCALTLARPIPSKE